LDIEVLFFLITSFSKYSGFAAMKKIYP